MSGARDRIRLSGIAATGYHGVFEHERREGQTFVADVVLHVDTRPAAAEDRLDLTVHYGVLAEQVAAVLAGEPADLVETVAERIAALALGHAAVHAVDVVVHKPQAPIEVPFGDVAVEVHRDRQHAPVVAAPDLGVAAVGDPEEATAGGPSDGPRADADPFAAWSPVATVALPTAPSGGAHAAAPAAASGEHTVPTTPSVPAPPVAVDPLDREPAAPVAVVLALGSNVGPSQDILRAAVADLADVPGLELTAVSPLARTAAVGGPDQPDYLNAVVLGLTTLSPRALLHACQGVEQKHGRERAERWGPRTLDVDLVVHGTTVSSADDLELPHPRAHERAFVLQPWAQVDPTAVLPGLGGGPVDVLARTAPDRDGIRWMALDWWQAPGGSR